MLRPDYSGLFRSGDMGRVALGTGLTKTALMADPLYGHVESAVPFSGTTFDVASESFPANSFRSLGLSFPVPLVGEQRLPVIFSVVAEFVGVSRGYMSVGVPSGVGTDVTIVPGALLAAFGAVTNWNTTSWFRLSPAFVSAYPGGLYALFITYGNNTAGAVTVSGRVTLFAQAFDAPDLSLMVVT